jgi:glutathione S-transferase
MSNDLKLYHSAASPNSRRVRIFLAEKGIAIPLAPVDLASGDQHSDAYRAIIRDAVVPTLVLEDGTAIGEVPAIWRYLEEVYPASPLLGSTQPVWNIGLQHALKLAARLVACEYGGVLRYSSQGFMN